ncbi:hypothetical protein [Vibrio owensii]|uniref:hypothetical protein n=1 Tax=Vibrio harveyi group TaxID=717610 RepID=UPI003CC6ABC3
MFRAYVRNSPNELSTNLGFGSECSWHSINDFFGFLKLMGCPSEKIEQFNSEGTVSFLIADCQSGMLRRHFYTVHRRLAFLEADFRENQRFQQQCAFRSLEQIRYNPTANF